MNTCIRPPPWNFDFFCRRKSGQISYFIHDLVSIELTVSTVFLLGRKAYRKVLIYLDLSNVQRSGPVQRTGHDSRAILATESCIPYSVRHRPFLEWELLSSVLGKTALTVIRILLPLDSRRRSDEDCEIEHPRLE